MSVTRADRRDRVLLVVHGDLDLPGEGQLLAAVSPVLRELSGRPLVLDLSGVDFAASVGLSDLIMIDHDATSNGHSVRIVVGDNRRVRKLLAMVGLDHRLRIVDSLDDALDR